MTNTKLTSEKQSRILSIVEKILQDAEFNGKAVDVVKLANKNGFSVFKLK